VGSIGDSRLRQFFRGTFLSFNYTLSLMAPKQNDLKLPKKLIEQLGGESRPSFF
jgi:hypothetical protein